MTNPRQALYFRQVFSQSAIGLAAAGAITAVGYKLGAGIPIAGCLYLLLVVVESVFASFVCSAIVSVIAIGCLDYFFVPPLFTLRISHPLDAIALMTFLATALVITSLASRAREEARNAEGRRRDLARLYDLAAQLVSIGPNTAVTGEYLGVFRDVFDLQAVCLFDAEARGGRCEGDSRYQLSERTKQSFISGRNYDDEIAALAIRCLRAGTTTIGAVGFEGLREGGAMAGPLSMLVAAMVQRAHSFQHASEAAAATQVEVLRSAVLDAFAHQFKTPLAAILTAAGSLRSMGPLISQQEEMVETIENQAAGLGHLTTRLLRMARLDRDQIQPKLRGIDLTRLVQGLLKQYQSKADGHNLTATIEDSPVEVLAESEMLALAIIQLLDNAFRYSPAGAAITVTVAVEDEGAAMIRVANQGRPILPEEQNRIFDRYYRGAAGHEVSGTGLGLYVARKIVLAHGGALELDTEHRYGPETTFCLKLPLARDEVKYELKASESIDR
jgi:two-component system, OmpR family, sensor histidine kinase KdpD